MEVGLCHSFKILKNFWVEVVRENFTSKQANQAEEKSKQISRRLLGVLLRFKYTHIYIRTLLGVKVSGFVCQRRVAFYR